MPEGRTKDKLLIFVLFAVGAMCIGIILRECTRPKPQNPAVITEIKHYRDTIKLYDRTKYRDTIYSLTTRYRTRIDSVRIWVGENSTWDSVCEIAGVSGQREVDCMRLLLSDHIRAEYQDTLMAVYRLQRSEDSAQIGYLMQLDSLNSVALREAQKPSKVSDYQTKGERLKQAGKIALSAIVGFLVGRL